MLKGKNIILTVTNDLSYDQRMIRICNSLANAGAEVLLVGREKLTSIPLESQTFGQYRLKCPFEKGILFYLTFNLQLFFFLLFRKFHAVCAVDLDTIAPCLLASKLKGRYCVYDAHEYYTESIEIAGRPFVKRIWTIIGQWSVPYADRCYTVAENLAQILSTRYRQRFEVIRNLPESVDNSWAVVRDKIEILLYQGVLNEGRGLMEIIDVLPAFPGVKLWLVGEGDLSEALKKRVLSLQLDEQVIFLGYLPPKVLRKITPLADIGLNLLENRGDNYYYSLANKTFDYLQAGLPSIHMKFPEYKALNQEIQALELIENLEPNSIKAALEKLLGNHLYYERLLEQCKAAGKRLTWDVEADRLTGIYESLFSIQQAKH